MFKIIFFVSLLTYVSCSPPDHVSGGNVGENGGANANPNTGLLDTSGDLLSAVKGILRAKRGQLSAIVGLELIPVCAQIMKEFAVRLTGLDNGLNNIAPGQMTPDQSGAVYSAIGTMIEFALNTEYQLNRELLSRFDMMAEYGTRPVPTAQDAANKARQVVAQTRRQLVDSFKRTYDTLKQRANADERIKPAVQVFENIVQTVDKGRMEMKQRVRQLVVDQLSKVEEWILRGTGDGNKQLEQYRRQLREQLIQRLTVITAEMI